MLSPAAARTGPSWRDLASAEPAGERTAVPERREAGRRAVGALMARSAYEILHYYLASTVDLGPATAWLAERNASRPVAQRLLPAVLFVKATALAARGGPDAQRLLDRWFQARRCGARRDGGLPRGGGLVAPRRNHADRLDLDELDGRPVHLAVGRAPSREAAQLGDERPHDHRDEPGRGGC